MLRRNLIIEVATVSFFCFCIPTGAVAQSADASAYPAKFVKVLIANAPGGPADIIARLIGQKLGEMWKQSLVYENRAGAGGIVATQTVARAAPDGYTALVTSTSFAVNAALVRAPGYDPEKDLIPAIIVAWSPNIFVVHPAVKAATLSEFIALARSASLKSASLNFGSSGAGTTPFLSGEHLFKILAKVAVTHVPYNGAAPALAAVVGGHIEMAAVAMPPAVPMVKSGQVRALAVTSSKRVAALPNVPTAAESGFPDVADYTWVAFFYPTGTPVAIVERLNADVNAALKQADLIERLTQAGFDPVGGRPAEAARYVSSEVARWARIVKELGISAE